MTTTDAEEKSEFFKNYPENFCGNCGAPLRSRTRTVFDVYTGEPKVIYLRPICSRDELCSVRGAPGWGI